MGINLFNSVKMTKPKRNKFDLTHDVKLSGKIGQLIPSCVMEVVPGDQFTIASDVFLRFAPLIAPVMHRIDVSMHYFFVPNRILWENWEKFITNEITTGVPYINVTDGLSVDAKKFLDYMGVPPVPTGGATAAISALPLAAYQCIYNEYFRDQNLVPEVNYKVTDGVNPTTELCKLRKRAWEHDYFTAALPFAQKGAAVDIPLGDVELKDNWTTNGNPSFKDTLGGVVISGTVHQDSSVVGGQISVNRPGPNNTAPVAFDPDGTLQVTPTTINELRRAFRLQEWLKKTHVVVHVTLKTFYHTLECAHQTNVYNVRNILPV